MNRLLRVLAGTAAVTTAVAGLSGCNASPYAASVNGQVIKQTAFESELKAWASAPGYVSVIDQNNSTANGGVGVTVAGAAPGSTYNSVWAANQLDGMIQAAIIHQHLAATNALPDQALLNAARSVSEIGESRFWYQFSPSFRQTLVQRLADEAALTQPSSADTTPKQVYDQDRVFFYSRVCVLQATVVDPAQAQALSAGGALLGTPLCYSQADMENQPLPYQQTVLSTAVGQTSKPLKSTYGYQVVKVTSRVEQPFGPEVQQAIAAIISEASGAGVAPAVAKLVADARVKVNPAYGSWSNGQVHPPPAPPSPARSQ